MLDDALAAKVAAASKDKASLIDLYTAGNATRLGFVLPVYAIQGAATTAPIATLVAIKNVDAGFFKLLQHPGATDKSLEAVLLRKEGDNVAYLSPVNEAQPLATRFALTTPDLDAAFAVQSPGDFAVRKDRQSHATLMTSRPIAATPWVVMVHIGRDQAFAEVTKANRYFEFMAGFVLLAMMLGIVALWTYERARLATRLEAQEKLLRVVTDNQPEAILIVDRDNVAHFANARAADAFQMTPEDVAGKDLTALMGPVRAREYSEDNKAALAGPKSVTRERHVKQQVVQSQHVPLAQIPIDTLPKNSPGVLIVDQDVTDIVSERERRAHILQKLIDVLVYIVDNRDPYAAHHSVRVALAAHEVAAGMGLDPLWIATTETAGKLMNVGKIKVPRALLIKSGELKEDELRLVRDSMQLSADFIQDIKFDGPVTETLRQMQERYDGAGPLGIKGESILVSARIIAAVNAFVGMISPRSHREAMTADQAVKNLLQGIDTRFDRKVVVALADYVENRKGAEALERLAVKG